MNILGLILFLYIPVLVFGVVKRSVSAPPSIFVHGSYALVSGDLSHPSSAGSYTSLVSKLSCILPLSSPSYVCGAGACAVTSLSRFVLSQSYDDVSLIALAVSLARVSAIIFPRVSS